MYVGLGGAPPISRGQAGQKEHIYVSNTLPGSTLTLLHDLEPRLDLMGCQNMGVRSAAGTTRDYSAEHKKYLKNLYVSPYKVVDQF